MHLSRELDVCYIELLTLLDADALNADYPNFEPCQASSRHDAAMEAFGGISAGHLLARLNELHCPAGVSCRQAVILQGNSDDGALRF